MEQKDILVFRNDLCFLPFVNMCQQIDIKSPNDETTTVGQVFECVAHYKESLLLSHGCSYTSSPTPTTLLLIYI